MRAFTNRAGEASGTFFGEAGARKWSGWSSLRGPERNELCPRVGAEGRLEAIFRAYRAGKQKQPFFFPYKTEITSAREKLVAQRRRREGVYNRAAEASVTFPGGADTRERADSPRTGGWSIADFVSAKRNAGEFCFLCFITKEVPARHEGCKLAIPQKVYLPGCAGPAIFRAYLFSLSNGNKPRPKKSWQQPDDA